MATLPSEKFLIQQIDGAVILFERYTEDVIVKFDPTNGDDVARAQHVIYESNLSAEDKCFAHLWSGYFYAYGTQWRLI